MPHVVIERAAPLRHFVEEFVPIVERSGESIVKVEEVYLGSRGKQALALAVVVENGASTKFFIDLLEKDSAITVRLFPLTDPEKTPSVKRLMGLLAVRIRGRSQQAHWGKTNIEDYLPRSEGGD